MARQRIVIEWDVTGQEPEKKDDFWICKEDQDPPKDVAFLAYIGYSCYVGDMYSILKWDDCGGGFRDDRGRLHGIVAWRLIPAFEFNKEGEE